jgi:stage II sporulation protein M
MPERALKPYLLTLAALFAVAFLAGFFAPAVGRKMAAETFQTFIDTFRDLPGGALFYQILMNNLIAGLLMLLLGLIVGILPVFAVGFNGFLLGALYRYTAGIAGYWNATWTVLPHGIFEFPALLIAASYGLWLGMSVLRRLRGKESLPIRGQMKHALRRYFAVVFPLLVVAAAIETALIILLDAGSR